MCQLRNSYKYIPNSTAAKILSIAEKVAKLWVTGKAND